MPYRFKIAEPVEKGFRRIAGEQLAVALAELDNAPDILPNGVHEYRKALKRLRALVRLASSALGRGKARRRTKALGEIARLLSARRDESVMLVTVAKLASEADASSTLAPLRAHLARLSGDAPKPLDADCAAEARRLLVREVKKFAGLRFRGRGFASLEKGLEASYRRARVATKNAYAEPTDESFHAMRKAVQWHWRQMSLLARAWPDEFAVRVTAAHELSQMLGDDHDLAMLITAAAKTGDISAEDKETIITLCERRQRTLRDAAEPRANRLFAEKPRAFTKRMAAYWKFGRASGQGLFRDARIEVQKPKISRKQNIQPPVEAAKPGSTKPRLAAKAPASAPSQRRA